MGEKTKITQVSKNYYRTVVPKCIMSQFKLHAGEVLDWQIEAKDGKNIIIVTPERKKK